MDIEELKGEIRMMTLMKRDSSLLKYILAECERYNKQPTAVIEKLIKDNLETYGLSSDERYLEENRILYLYLPQYISQEEIINHIGGLGLGSDGRSIGTAVKHLKSIGVNFRNEDVVKVLKEIGV